MIKFEIFTALKYLFSKKRHHAIHVISLVSIAGIAIGTMALVVVLSVFNGFDQVVKSLFNSYNPDLIIKPKTGKYFTIDSTLLNQISKIEGIENYTLSIEESALFQYHDRQYIGMVKGITDNYYNVTAIGDKITEGSNKLYQNNIPYAVVGQGVAYFLGINTDLFEPIGIYIPRKDIEITNLTDDFINKLFITPGGIFSVEQDIDNKYVLIPIQLMYKLLDTSNIASYIEIKLQKNFNANLVKQKLASVFLNNYEIKDRYQQQELLYKIMKSEKWAIFFILTFILIIATLNMISLLTMLIIEKQNDIRIFHFLGANWSQIKKIFLLHGWFNVLLGSFIGLVFGLIVCWIQQSFGIVKIEGISNFVIDVYPVRIIISDILLIVFTSTVIGFLASLLPTQVISNKYIIKT